MVTEVRIWSQHRFAIFAALLLCGAFVDVAAREQPADVVIVLDSSGSMRWNDPQSLRKPAAQMLIRLLREGDRAAVVSFSDQAWPIRRLSDTGSVSNRDDLAESVNLVSSQGMLTHLHAGLSGGMVLFDDISMADPERRRVLVFMTDGVMDTGDEADDERFRQLLITELVPQLRRQSIELHSIAFTLESDQDLLADVAQGAGGVAHLALTAQDLPAIFKKIFETVKQPDSLPIENRQFLVDEAVQELTLLIPAGEHPAVLIDPDDRRLAAQQHPENVRWYDTPVYSMVTIQAPVPGQWQLESSTADSSEAYILTDFRLEALAAESEQDDGMVRLEAWLSDDGQVVTDSAVVSAFDFSYQLIQPVPSDAHAMTLASERPGAVAANWQPLHPDGDVVIEITAIAPTVERQRRLHISLNTPQPEPTETVAEVAEESSPPEPETETTQDDTSVSVDALPKTEFTQTWLFRGLVLLAINLLLAFGVALWWWRSRGASDPADSLMDEESGS